MLSYSFDPHLERPPLGASSSRVCELQKSILLVWRPAFNSLTFFRFPTNLRALPVRDVTRTLSPRSVISGYCDISEWNVHPARALPPTSMFAPN